MAEITHLFHVDASVKKVFQAISTIKGLQQWWTAQTSGSDKIGEIIEFRFGENGFVDFKVIESIPNTLYKWKCTDAHPEWLGTEATFELSENEGKTQVKFTHSGWAEQTDFFAHCNFSWGRYFVSLRDYCETGQGQPYKIN